MNHKVRPARIARWRPIVLSAIGVVLAWLVVSHTGAATLARGVPEWALMLRGNEPEALITLAQKTLDEAHSQAREIAESKAQPTASSSAEKTTALLAAMRASLAPDTQAAQRIASLARQALLAAPLEARALRLMAQLADAADDPAQKTKLLEATLLRSKHESLAAYWLLLESIERQDAQAIVDHADIVMGKHQDLAPFVTLVLARLAESGDASDALKARLRQNPKWRWTFFHELPSAITDPRTPLNLLLALKGSAAPPTAPEVRHYLNFLVSNRLYELAYYAWLQFLPTATVEHVAALNNGDFEQPANAYPVPFEWHVPASSGAIVDLRPVPNENGKALYVEFVGQGRVDMQPVRQTTVLAPGRYRFAVRHRGVVTGQRGLSWTIVCAEDNKKIGATPLVVGAVSAWTEVAAEFTVPDAGCRGQVVYLTIAARSVSEQIVSGHAWFDDARITRRAGE